MVECFLTLVLAILIKYSAFYKVVGIRFTHIIDVDVVIVYIIIFIIIIIIIICIVLCCHSPAATRDKPRS